MAKPRTTTSPHNPAPGRLLPVNTRPLPENPHTGPGYVREQVGAAEVQTPATTRSGQLSAQQTSREIAQSAPPSTNSRTIDRHNIDGSTYLNHYDD